MNNTFTEQHARQLQITRQYAQAVHRPNPQLNWMIDGCAVEFADFVNIIFPEDSPERTAFLLKYTR